MYLLKETFLVPTSLCSLNFPFNVSAVNKQCATSATKISVSYFLKSSLVLQPPKSMSLVQMNIYTVISNKMVSDGAIAFYIGHYVTARVSKFAYGVPSATPFDS